VRPTGDLSGIARRTLSPVGRQHVASPPNFGYFLLQRLCLFPCRKKECFMLTLYSYPDLFGVADNNPFGLKVFAFMRLSRT
jgi:hypothetical protein